MVQGNAKAVEIPGLAIVGPFIEKWATLRDPLDKGPIERSTYSMAK